MTLRAVAVVPPIVFPVPLTLIPPRWLVRTTAPVTSVPIRLPSPRLLLAVLARVTPAPPLPELRLPAALPVAEAAGAGDVRADVVPGDQVAARVQPDGATAPEPGNVQPLDRAAAGAR